MARDWYKKGNGDLSLGRTADAVEDFRNALSYDPDNLLVQPRLAEALLADGRVDEARSYFLNLWDRMPGSGEVNLNLAHVSIQMGDADDAIRYYRSAIYGSWEKDPGQQRRAARLELCEFLLKQGRAKDAQAEIAGLAADAPEEDGALHEKTGLLFLQVDEPERALAEFEEALRSNEHQNQWLEEAGKAAYAADDYSKAETFLARAVRGNSSDDLVRLLETVRAVRSDDPFQPGLSDEEQALRTWRDLQRGFNRLQGCTGASAAGPSTSPLPSDLQSLSKQAQDMKRRANVQVLRKDSDLRNQAMQLVFQIEETTSRTCGTPVGADQALILIAKRHSGSNQ